MTKRHAASLLTTALVFLASLQAADTVAATRRTDAAGHAPRLIVGIAIDQLRTDYVYALLDRFGDDGFRRLLREGRVYGQVTFDLDNPDATAALAVLATGAYPFHNGIPAQQVYDARMQRRQSVFYDRTNHGFSTLEGLSPRALISTTLADELKTASGGASRVYAIAPDAEAAIIAAGHTANGAFWVDDRSGRWASTDYYREFPGFVERQNREQPLFIDVARTEWRPMQYRGGMLDIMPYHYATDEFRRPFSEHGLTCYACVKTSPYVNDAVMGLADLFLTNGRLGQGRYTDMLQLTFYAGTFLHERPELFAEELQDTYLRLDRTIARLLDAVDHSVGLDNAFIYVMGTGETVALTTDVEGTQLGEFNARRCTALLNTHLIALYGQAQWVAGFDNYQVYLDHDVIEQHRLKVSEVQQAAAEFVAMMKGVDEVVTSHQLLHEDFSDRIVSRRNSYHKLSGGDLLVSLQPGYVLRADDDATPLPQVRHDVAPGPAILFAPGRVEAERIAAPVRATSIAPTVARHLRIRAPSACREPALLE